ncbi:MAG TPA: glycosyltransferase family 1 protein [Blastocatellia bacterium]|nr:glycosyltransferase family 1 protein [Blastocatellia bacterium]
MRIALDAIPLATAKTGVGHYTDALAEGLARAYPDHQYDLVSPFEFDFGYNGDRPKNLNKQFIPVRSIFNKWWLVGLPALLRIYRVDVFHGTNYCIPVFAPCPTVVTIHDLSLFTQSHTHELANVKQGKRRMPIMARLASLIIAPSEWTRREIVEQLRISPEKIRVIYEAAREGMKPLPPHLCQSALDKYQIRRPYLLYVGTIEPRKNLLTLIRAYDELLRTTALRPQLALCGGRGWLYDEIFKLVEDLKLQDQIRFTGYVDDADLPALYSAAEAFVYPSFYEGFGLPPLEAMACGAPVITSDVSSLPEVVGKAGLTHAPNDTRALTEAMAQLLGAETAREHFRREGLKQAAKFSWERAARETQSVYDEVLKKGRRVIGGWRLGGKPGDRRQPPTTNRHGSN